MYIPCSNRLVTWGGGCCRLRSYLHVSSSGHILKRATGWDNKNNFFPLLTYIICSGTASLVAFIITLTTRGQGNLPIQSGALEMMQKSTVA